MKVISSQFESLKSALDDFQKNVKKDLLEIRECKREIQSMKNDLIESMGENASLTPGKYIRDNSRIILSAPEIIIGNVDRYGALWNMPSKVVVRANGVSLEGAGVDGASGGKVVTRASRIQSIAVDPGMDGTENVVLPVSEISSLARSVSLKSEDTLGVFTSSASPSMQGIELHSETGIALNATTPNETKKEKVTNASKDLKEWIKSLESASKDDKKQVESLMKDIQKLLDYDDMLEDELSTRTSYLDLEELFVSFDELSNALYLSMTQYFKTLSKLAEANRMLTSLEEVDSELSKQKSTFKTQSTNSFISLNSERISATSIDGDGNIRENPEAGVSINAKHVSIGTFKEDESLQDESTISLASRTVNISTIDPKVERNDDGELTKGNFPAVGDVVIQSKNIKLETVDYEWKDKKQQEKMLAKDGTIAMRAEKVDVSATDTEGKATGQVEVNAKAVEVKAMDVDKEKRTDKSLAAGSTMLLLAEKMYVGAKDSKNRSKQMQVVSDKTGVFADTTLELQQDKAVVQLSGGNAAVGGGNLDLYGKTTLQGEVTAKGKVTGGDIEMKNMKVSSSFKSPCTSEGVAVPGAPATGKLSAKLKEEELKTKEK